MKKVLTSLAVASAFASSAFAADYVRVTAAPDSWVGEYAVGVVKDGQALLWTGIDAADCHQDVAITDGKISGTDFVTIEVGAMAEGGGYYIKVKGGDNNGKYISSGTSAPNYSNGVKFLDNAHQVDLNLLEGDVVSISQTINETQKMYFIYNGTSNNNRYRFYKDTNFGSANYPTPALFKLEEEALAEEKDTEMVWDFTTLAAVEVGEGGNLKGAIKADDGSSWSNLQNNAAITDAELTLSADAVYPVTAGLKFTAGGSGWIHVRNYPDAYNGTQLFSNNKDLMMTVPAKAGQYIIITALSASGATTLKAIEANDTTSYNVVNYSKYIYQSKAGDVKFNIGKQFTIKKIEVRNELPANGIWSFETLAAAESGDGGNLKNAIKADDGSSWSNLQNNAAITEEELTLSAGTVYPVTAGLKFTAGGSGWLHVRNYPEAYNGTQLYSNNKDLKVTVPAKAGQYIVFEALSNSGNAAIINGTDTVTVYPGGVSGYMVQAKEDNPTLGLTKQLTIKKIYLSDAAPYVVDPKLSAAAKQSTIKVGSADTLTVSSANKAAFVYATSNAEVVTVSNGIVTAVSAGEAEITVSQAANAYFKEAIKTIKYTVEQAGPSDFGQCIAEAVAGKAAGDTVVITLDKSVAYTFAAPAEAGLVNVVVNGNGATVTLSDSAHVSVMQGLEINNVNFDCAANSKMAIITLSATPDSTLLVANSDSASVWGSSRTNAFVDNKNIVLNQCNFSEVKVGLFSVNAKPWILGGLTVNECIIQFNKDGGKPYINFENSNNEGALKNFVIKNSTLYNIVESNNAYFIRFANASNGQASKAFTGDPKEYITFTNNTFVNIASAQKFGNNTQNNNAFIDEIKGNVFYNVSYINKYIQTNNTRNFTSEDNAICGITTAVDGGDLKIATEDTLLCKGEKPFSVPSVAYDFNAESLKAAFTPYGLSYAGQNGLGDPRWKAEVIDPMLALKSDSVMSAGVQVVRPATWLFEKAGQTYTLAVSSKNKAAISYASSDEAVATVDENGVITSVAPGYATITATQEPTVEFKAGKLEVVVMTVKEIAYHMPVGNESINTLDLIANYSINGATKTGLNANATDYVRYYNPGAPIEVQNAGRWAYVNPEGGEGFMPSSTDGTINVGPVVGTQKTLTFYVEKTDSIKFYYTGSGGSSTTVTLVVKDEAGETVATVEGGAAAGKNAASNFVAYTLPSDGKYSLILSGTTGDMEVYAGILYSDNVAAIETIDAEVANEGIMFNLAGQRINKANGLVIMNGKKMIIRK